MPSDKNQRLHHHPYRYALITGMVLLLAGATALYIFGFRPGPGLTFVRTGSVVITGVPAGGVMYVDELRRTTSTGNDVSLPLVPGTHTIIVDVADDYPWSDLVTIETKKDTVVSPILVSKDTSKSLLSATETADASNRFKTATLPTVANPISIESRCSKLYVQNNQLIVSLASTTNAKGTVSTQPCTIPNYQCVNGDCSPTIVFSPRAPLQSVILFPGRNDAVILSYGNMVVALEIDPQKPQYFAPIAENIAAKVIPDTDHSVLLQTAGHVYRIPLR